MEVEKTRQTQGKEIEHRDTFGKDGRLYYSFNVLRSNRLRPFILQSIIKDVNRIN